MSIEHMKVKYSIRSNEFAHEKQKVDVLRVLRRKGLIPAVSLTEYSKRSREWFEESNSSDFSTQRIRAKREHGGFTFPT